MAAAVGRIVRMYVMYIFVYKFGRAFCLMSKQNTRVHTTLIARVFMLYPKIISYVISCVVKGYMSVTWPGGCMS